MQPAPGQVGGQVGRLLTRIGGVLLFGPLVLILLYRFVPVPITPLMVIRMIQGQPLHHQWVAYRDISPALSHALIASEDNLFCDEKFGFDFSALRGQVDAWEDGKRPRGASTITMQTAKNLFLWPDRSTIRKGIEAYLTPQIALLWPKRRVLEVYLNSVEFGPGIYGAEAAAQRFFHRSAAELTPYEAALLISVLPRPLVYVASPPGPYVRNHAGEIERKIEQLGPLLDCAQ
ncbi:MAG: monofunctional biosynthetic peptidoglycan transglycosylase [Acetobacteraceae bacterium]